MRAISFLLLLAACATEYKENPIKATFHSKDFLYRQCYQESDSYRGRHQTEKRKVDVHFTINVEGKVQDVTFVKSDFEDPNFHTCLKGIFKLLRFENIKSPLKVDEQIIFDTRTT